MKTIPLTQSYEAIVDDCDYERVNQLKWCASIAKRRDDGTPLIIYARSDIYVDGVRKCLRMHRFILSLDNPRVMCDHWNHDGLNNTRENLRVCTNTQNQANSRMRSANTSGVKGVTWNRFKGKWQAQIKVSGVTRYLGRFSKLEDAASAYLKASVEMHGEFSCAG